MPALVKWSHNIWPEVSVLQPRQGKLHLKFRKGLMDEDDHAGVCRVRQRPGSGADKSGTTSTVELSGIFAIS